MAAKGYESTRIRGLFFPILPPSLVRTATKRNFPFDGKKGIDVQVCECNGIAQGQTDGINVFWWNLGHWLGSSDKFQVQVHEEHRECPSDGNGGINVKKVGCAGMV